jgi:hypothetical protein
LLLFTSIPKDWKSFGKFLLHSLDNFALKLLNFIHFHPWHANGVQVNQRSCFLPNVCGFPLPTRLQWLEPAGGEWKWAENGHVNLPLPMQMDEIFSSFHYGPYKSLAVKFKRFFELRLLVKPNFHFISSRSWTKYFAMIEYRSYLKDSLHQDVF